jgi:Probable sensor domain DACNV
MTKLFTLENDAIQRIHNKLAHLATITPPWPSASVQPLTREQLSNLIETAFWASVRSNEGRATRVCITVASPKTVPGALAFKTPQAYDRSQIVKLAAAVPPNGSLLVSADSDQLHVWGFSRSRGGWGIDTVSIEISEPGTIRFCIGPIRPFAVLTGDAVQFIEGTSIDLAAHLQRVLHKALQSNEYIETQAIWLECLAIRNLARTIVEDGHGGIILIVPNAPSDCLNYLDPFDLLFETPDTSISDAIRQSLRSQFAEGEAFQRLSEKIQPDDQRDLFTLINSRPQLDWGASRETRHIASLAGVDGAIVMTGDLQTLGFGATIAVPKEVVSPIVILSPEPGPQPVALSQLQDVGGTRHQSAARFVAATRETVALVISQDRHLSVMHWENEFNAVAVIRNAEWLA